MEAITKELTIDLYGPTLRYAVEAHQGDRRTRYLLITVTENGDPYTLPTSADYIAQIKRPDNVHVYIPCAMENNLIKVELKGDALKKAGRAVCEIVINESTEEQTLTTQSFEIEIAPMAGAANSVEASDDLPSMEEQIKKNTEAISSLTEKKVKLKDEIVELAGIVTGTKLTPEYLGTGYYIVSGEKFTEQADATSSRFKIDLSDYIGEEVQVSYQSTKIESTRVSGLGSDDMSATSFTKKESGFAVGELLIFTPTEEHHTLYVSYSSAASNLIVGCLDGLQSATRPAINAFDYLGYTFESGYYISDNGVVNVNPTSIRCVSGFIPCAAGATVKYYGESNHANISVVAFYDRDKNFIGNNCNVGPMDVEYTTTAPNGTVFVRLSFNRTHKYGISIVGGLADSVTQIYNSIPISSTTSIAFVSTSGDDSNDGTLSSPFATVNKALQLGANEIYMFEGVYNQAIDLSNTFSGEVKIANYTKTGRVIFEPSDNTVAISDTAVSGYTKVYSASYTDTVSSSLVYLYHEGVADVNTLISDDERHPLERGREYRCEDTIITKCSNTVLSDALSEIENAKIPKWFFDADNGIMYFSRTQAVTSDNPIRKGTNNNLFLNATRQHSLKLYGIETRYMCFNINLTTGSEVVDCRSANAMAAGGFRYDSNIGGSFVRCEAVGVASGPNGDGFNGHSSSSGDIHSKQTTMTLIDCWSHDNQDDGYSDHERCETTIIGGLYEYNGKAGITPSYGSHCTCNGVYSRHNYNGFYYTGTATEAEGGKYGQMICYNCVAEENTIGGAKTGFRVDGDGNCMTLVGCKSIGNLIGYALGNSTNAATLIDCGSQNNTTVKSVNGGTMTIKNTQIVSD